MRVPAPGRTRPDSSDVLRSRAVRSLVARGGRYSLELGIDLDAGGATADEWFLAATLFGTRIGSRIVLRTYRVLADAGVRTLNDCETRSWDDLVRLLDAGGYARYDFRTATRLQQLAAAVDHRFGGTVSSLRAVADPAALEATLDSLPGWGPTTVRVFLRELRGVWPGAQPTLDERALRAAAHLGIAIPRSRAGQVDALGAVAGRAEVDVRDLEAALVRLALSHRDMSTCPGGRRCRALAEHRQSGQA